MKVHYFAVFSLLSSLTLISCGGGGSSGYKSIKNADAVSLSSSEKTVVKNTLSSGSKTGKQTETSLNSVLSGSSALKQASSLSHLMLNGVNDNKRAINFNNKFSETCDKSGNVEMALTMTGSTSGTQWSSKGNIKSVGQFKFSDCASEDGILSGGMTMSFDMDMTATYDSANMKMDMSFSGGLTGEGKSDEGQMERHTIAFKDFSLKMEMDKATFEKYSEGASELTQEQSEAMALDILKCKGSVVIDERDIPCDGFMKLAIEDEELSALDKISSK